MTTNTTSKTELLTNLHRAEKILASETARRQAAFAEGYAAWAEADRRVRGAQMVRNAAKSAWHLAR